MRLRTPARLVPLFALFGSPFLAVWPAAGAGATAVEHAAVREWLDGNVPLYMQRARMPGFSVAVVSGGETIYAEGFGLRDAERALPATPDTLYGIGSITKSFVAIAVLQLVEAGKVDLDAPVSSYLPFELGEASHPILVRHLLTHSLGIPSLATSTVAISRGLGRDTGIPFGTAADFYRFVNGARNEQVAPPGERFFYHNAAWRLLGDIIQRASGTPFHAYVEKNVIDPLGMPRTGLDLDDFDSDPDHIVPYLKGADGSNQPARFPYPNPAVNPGFSFLSAAGGIFSSVNEMTRYLQAHLDRGRAASRRVITPESFTAMQTLHIETGAGHYGAEGYGYGLGITPDFLGHRMISHGGSIAVSTAYLAFVPDLDAGVVMMGNSSGMDYATIAESVFALLLGRDPDEVVPATRIRARMARLAGSYEVYRGLERLEVVERSGLLYLQTENPFAPGEASLTPLIPDDPSLERTTFYTLSNGVRSPVEFRLGEDGRIDLLLGRYRYHRKG